MHAVGVELLLRPQHAVSDGQVVTLLVGVGLELLDRHASGVPFGPLHPAHLAIDDRGRPRLRPVTAPPQWTPHDDWVALLRLGRVLGASDRAALLSHHEVDGREGVELLRWLMEWAEPRSLTASTLATRR